MGNCSSNANQTLSPKPSPDADPKPSPLVAIFKEKDNSNDRLIDFEPIEFKDLPQFDGKMIQRGEEGYTTAAYQYASSTFAKDGLMQPAVIVYAKGDEDVIKVIEYAKVHHFAVSIRTGGNQQSGASSTYGKNLQLDLSETYREFKWENRECTQVTVGVSWPLKALSAELGKKNRFVPVGQNCYSHVGGHSQTAGMTMCGRSFGLFPDHIQSLRIINAEGQIKLVKRGVDEELFFALIGGSPGNFGVVTHVTINVYKDEHYPQSRAYKAMYFYTPEALEALTDVLVEMSMDLKFAGDWDYCITVLSSYENLIPTVPPEAQKELEEKFPDKFLNGSTPPVILVFVQWANLEGEEQEYDPSFVNKIKKAGGDTIPVIGVQLNDDVHVPMSKLIPQWSFDAQREYDLPYVKRTYMSNSMTLNENGWAKWVVGRVETIQNLSNSGCKIVMQLQNLGGGNSQFFRKGYLDMSTALSWRDSNVVCVMDCFHTKSETSKTAAETWAKGNDEGVGPEGKFCAFDRRMLWGSYDLNLHSVKKCYYDNSAKYERLVAIKHEVDPQGVFSPNEFCIGNSLCIEDVNGTKLSESEAKFVEAVSDDQRWLPKAAARLNRYCFELTGGVIGIAGGPQVSEVGQHQMSQAQHSTSGIQFSGTQPGLTGPERGESLPEKQSPVNVRQPESGAPQNQIA